MYLIGFNCKKTLCFADRSRGVPDIGFVALQLALRGSPRSDSFRWLSAGSDSWTDLKEEDFAHETMR